jgi:hypothetical protein
MKIELKDENKTPKHLEVIRIIKLTNALLNSILFLNLTK